MFTDDTTNQIPPWDRLPPPTQSALAALQSMLERATVEPMGDGSLEWTISIGVENISVIIGPNGEWVSTATWTSDD